MSVRLWTKWLWVRIPLHSLKLKISRLFRARSSLKFRQLQSVVRDIRKRVCDMIRTPSKDCFSPKNPKQESQLPKQTCWRQFKAFLLLLQLCEKKKRNICFNALQNFKNLISGKFRTFLSQKPQNKEFCQNNLTHLSA